MYKIDTRLIPSDSFTDFIGNTNCYVKLRTIVHKYNRKKSNYNCNLKLYQMANYCISTKIIPVIDHSNFCLKFNSTKVYER